MTIDVNANNIRSRDHYLMYEWLRSVQLQKLGNAIYSCTSHLISDLSNNNILFYNP